MVNNKFDAILEEFDVYGIQIIATDDIKEKCLRICDTYNLTSEQIAVSWLEIAGSKEYDEVTLESLGVLEEELNRRKQTDTKNVKDDISDEYTALPSMDVLSNADNDLLAAYGAASPATAKPPASSSTPNATATPISKRSFGFSQPLDDLKDTLLAPSLSQSPTTQQSKRFSQRTNSGAVVASFGDGSLSGEWKADLSYSPEVKRLPCGGERSLSAAYNFMFEKLRSCAEVLDETIFNLASQLKESLKLEDFAPLESVSNEPVWCVGRICCDSVGRLNAASVLLEGDCDNSSGASVRLDLSKLKQYSLFPGQVVAVKGINSTGESLIAEEIINGRILPIPQDVASPKADLQIRIACGPFTTLENLLYEPLIDLLRDVVQNPPHVLFLLGPLLDSSHPALDDPMLSDSYDSILGRCLEKINSALGKLATRVFIVTSHRDICCPPIYPTPPVFMSGSNHVPDRITVLPDPSLLCIDGVVIGLTTIDYPMQISREEISFTPQGSDRLARLSRHILLQQSFYPIYPPPEGLNLNIEQADLHTRLPCSPHILITPSDLKGYVKDVNGCLFINPERLTKGKIGGSHCKIEVKQLVGENKQPEINVNVLKI